MRVRLLPPADWDGPTNMAADEVLLEGAIAGGAGLRFYTWCEPTVSLGYFQSARDLQSISTLASLPFVRRATGGAMLVHHFELTYALTLPAGPSWQPRGQSWICRMHEIVATTLRAWNVVATIVAFGEERKLGDVLCFQHQTPGDLLIAGRKVAGSAQRKSRGALLQHGGIVLRRSPHAPHLPGIADQSAVELTVAELRNAIGSAFAEQTGWQIIPEDWTGRESERTSELRQEKYAAKAWNLKR